MDPPPPRPAGAKSSTSAAGSVEKDASAGASVPQKAETPTNAAQPPPSDQMRVASSGRRKVALPPGRSQLDWIRNSRELPIRAKRSYTLAEVREHASLGDAWMIVHGMVYDVTPYVEYHPGGVPMMMAGAGKDASKLFDKYHAWVNLGFMLERCCLGYYDARPGDDDDSSDEDEDDIGAAS